MIRGTTPTHVFTLSVEPDYFKNIRITYAQDDVVLFQKEKGDCEIEGYDVRTTLTQEETLMFDAKKHVQIQVKAITEEGKVEASPIMCVTVGKCLDNEVMM